jgi:hypothetical protein
VATNVEIPRASADQVIGSQVILRELAAREGLSNLRLAVDGTVFVHIDHDPGYGPVLRFVEAATRVLGAEPNVVTDETPAARAKLPTSAAL